MIIKLLEKKVTYLFMYCIAFILCYQFYLNNIPELFPFAHELGDIQYRICFAFITSYIFYVLITFIPKEKDKENVYAYIEPKKEQLISTIENFFEILVEIANTKVLEDPRKQALKTVLFEDRTLEVHSLSLKDIKDICKIIDPKSTSPLGQFNFNKTFESMSWAKFIKYHVESMNQQVSDILVLMPHLETGHIKLLSDLKDTEFFRIVRIGKVFDFLEADIEIFEYPINKYYYHISTLKKNW